MNRVPQDKALDETLSLSATAYSSTGAEKTFRTTADSVVSVYLMF